MAKRSSGKQGQTRNKSSVPSSTQGASAAQRREQQRSQRQASAQRSQQQRNRRKVQRKSNTGLWITLGVVVAAIVVVIGIFIYVSTRPTSSGGNGSNGNSYPTTSADPTVVQAITNVSPSTLAAVGVGPAKAVTPPTKLNFTSLLTGSGGKPEVFYEGGEYCPFCAAERWAMIVALSRFGTFHNLSQESSSSTDVYPSTPTFSFYHSSYTSQYIDFVPLEQESYKGVNLETPTSAEQQIINTYNPGESFPFIDIANKYSITGASYDPGKLANLDWQGISSSLSNPNNPVAQVILGTANYLTAAICEATNQQPASVCQAAPIPQVEQKLNGTTGSSGGNMALGMPVAITRRWN